MANKLMKLKLLSVLIAASCIVQAANTSDMPSVSSEQVLPADVGYSIRGAEEARPINVFALDGNLYLQFPEDVGVNKAWPVAGRKGGFSYYSEAPYVVVEGGAAGVRLATTHGTILVVPRHKQVQKKPDASSARKAKPHSSRGSSRALAKTGERRKDAKSSSSKKKHTVSIQPASVERELRALNAEVERALEKARRAKQAQAPVSKEVKEYTAKKATQSRVASLSKNASVVSKLSPSKQLAKQKNSSKSVHERVKTKPVAKLPVMQHKAPVKKVAVKPKPKKKITWVLKDARLSVVLRNELNKRGHSLVWKPSFDYDIPVPVQVTGRDLPDVLDKVSVLYGLPISLCQGNKVVVVYPPGTPTAYMTCGHAPRLYVDQEKKAQRATTKAREQLRDTAEQIWTLEDRGTF